MLVFWSHLSSTLRSTSATFTPVVVPSKASRDIGIRFPNLTGFASNAMRRETSQLSATQGSANGTQTNSPTSAALTTG
uniref:Secreted protein n=1 Tax=Syphacia muris TaxID=451379 RepID=A0A0N5B1F0_9BILA